MKHSSKKQKFPSGAVRDSRDGKGRYDLISPYAMRRLAHTLEFGAIKYGDRNWEKGWPVMRIIDSLKRHLAQYEMGETDEDHLGRMMFNAMALSHTQEMIDCGQLPKELDDRPVSRKKRKR